MPTCIDMIEATKKAEREREREGGRRQKGTQPSPCECDLGTKQRKVGSYKQFHMGEGGHDSYNAFLSFTAHPSLYPTSSHYSTVFCSFFFPSVLRIYLIFSLP